MKRRLAALERQSRMRTTAIIESMTDAELDAEIAKFEPDPAMNDMVRYYRARAPEQLIITSHADSKSPRMSSI